MHEVLLATPASVLAEVPFLNEYCEADEQRLWPVSAIGQSATSHTEADSCTQALDVPYPSPAVSIFALGRAWGADRLVVSL